MTFDLALSPQDPASRNEQRKAAQQDVFLREVDDAMRQDQMEGFFKRFGIPVIAVVVLSLLALAGYLTWDHFRTRALDERGEKFVLALDDVTAGNLPSADGKLGAIEAGESGGSAAAARLMRAAIAAKQGKTDDAAAQFGKVAGDDDAPQPLRDLALIRQTALEFGKLPPATVLSRLKPLAEPGGAWFGPAGELVGMAYLKQNRPDLAGPLFAQIARDKTQPNSLRGRMRQMAGVLGFDAIDDVVEASQANGNRAPDSGADAAAAQP